MIIMSQYDSTEFCQMQHQIIAQNLMLLSWQVIQTILNNFDTPNKVVLIALCPLTTFKFWYNKYKKQHFFFHHSQIGSFLSTMKCILSLFRLYRWPELGLTGSSRLLSIFPIVQWRRGCCTAFLVPCQSLSQFTFKASAQLSTPVVKPTLSIHIVSVKKKKMKICISTESQKKKKKIQKNPST